MEEMHKYGNWIVWLAGSAVLVGLLSVGVDSLLLAVVVLAWIGITALRNNWPAIRDWFSD